MKVPPGKRHQQLVQGRPAQRRPPPMRVRLTAGLLCRREGTESAARWSGESGWMTMQAPTRNPTGYVGVAPECIGAFFAGSGYPRQRVPRNGCAQAAVACLLDYWGLARGWDATGAALMAEVYRRFPPDSPFALWGTTPGRLERICRACGF